MRTRLSALPVPDLIRELVIAHTKPGLHRVYDLHAYVDEKRHALDLWAADLRGILEAPSANAAKTRGVMALPEVESAVEIADITVELSDRTRKLGGLDGS